MKTALTKRASYSRVAVLLCCLALLPLSGCKQKARGKAKAKPAWALAEPRPRPGADIPIELRHRNPDGRCVHMAFGYAITNQSGPNGRPLYDLAEAWWRRHRGGENADGLRAKADAWGIRYCDTVKKSVAFIDWASGTGRGCIVNDAPGHVRFLTYIDPPGTPNAKAFILDNNGPRERVLVYDRDDWLRNHWRGWAATPIYDPEPAVTRP